MLIISKILYAKQIDVNKEIAMAKWMNDAVREKSGAFELEGMKAWNGEGSCCYESFKKKYITMKWYLLSLGN